MAAMDVMCFEVVSISEQMEKTTFLVSCNTPDDEDGTSMEMIKSRCCKEANCELVGYHSLPDFLKHNEFILNYYRSEWPLKQTIMSVFSIHNETLNIWTHLIGFFIFLALATTTAMVFPMDSSIMPSPAPQHLGGAVDLNLTATGTSNYNMSQPWPAVVNTTAVRAEPEVAELAQTAVARWPFYAYLCGAMFCMLMSTACHLLSCHSEHTCYVTLRLDYAGIAALIVTSFYPLVYYSFACDPFFQDLYIGFITVFGAATVLVSLAPVFETPEFRYVRSGLFICMAVSGLVPIVHKSILFSHRPEAVLTTGYEVVMGVFYGLGVVVYVARVPERWLPGKFDLAGHSHQLFHVLVIAGAYMHYLAGTVYLRWREMEGCY